MNGKVEDAKADGADSSTVPPDATEASSTSMTAAADSSPQGEKQPGSISEALEKVQLEMPPEEAGDAGDSKEPTAAEPPPTETESGETDPEPVTAPKDGQAAKATDGAPGADAPFHTRPEWQNAMKVLNTLPDKGAALKPILRDAFQRETRANEQLQALKPHADIAQELRQIVGGEQEFNTMRQVVRGFAAGDPAVLPILKQMVQSIEKSNGEVISSPDLVERQSALQRQVDEGLIDQKEFEAQANLLKEVERTRAGRTRAETQLKTTAETQRAQQVEQQQRQQVEAINSWESNIRQRDPDFGAVTDVTDPKHGESIADQVFDAMSLRFIQKPGTTTEELVQVAQRAYDRAKRTAPTPPLRTQRVVTSQSSSTTGKQKPRSMREAMDAVKLE